MQAKKTMTMMLKKVKSKEVLLQLQHISEAEEASSTREVAHIIREASISKSLSTKDLTIAV